MDSVAGTHKGAIDPQPYAQFLLRQMMRPSGLPDGGRAVTETEHALDNDVWAWADDNAKVIEFLSRPEIWQRCPGEMAELITFLRQMCVGPLILRRISMPRLETRPGSEDAWLHALMDISCNLQRGLSMLGIRFHDGRTARYLNLTGNYVTFTYAGTLITLDVEDAIHQHAATLRDGRLELVHTSALRFNHQGKERRLGALTYTTTVLAGSMVIGVEARLDLDPGIEVEDVMLTIAHDDLSHGDNGVQYRNLMALGPDGAGQRFSAPQPGRYSLAAPGTQYYAIAQDEMHGFALGILSLPRSPERLSRIEVVVEQAEKLHWVGVEYRFAGPQAGGTSLVVGEDKILASGGFYAELATYKALLAEEVATASPHRAARDLSISYDYGVEINAFAKCFAVLRSGAVPEAAPLLADLRALADRYLEIYANRFLTSAQRGDNAVFSRQLAFVILATATMLRATGEEQYRPLLGALVDLMLRFEKTAPGITGADESGFLMGIQSARDVHVDCHSAALLALVHAAPHLDDPRIAAALDRGLASYALETAVLDWGQEKRKIDVLAVSWVDDAGQRRSGNAFWNYHVGLTLRLFGALRASPVQALQEVAQKHAARMEIFDVLMQHQIATATRPHAEGLEIRTSALSSETNSETQPWVMLGLLGHPCD